ncbi:MAG: hypothetical protein NVSMB31_16890 [Vulcanimicrobiaceae bacterium]
MPQGLALSPDGQTIAVVDSGAAPAAVQFFDAVTMKERTRVPLKGAFGTPVWDGADHIWVALANLHAVGRVSVTSGTLEQTIDTGAASWPAAIALSPDGKQLAFSDDEGAHLGLIDLSANALTQRVPTDRHPGDLAYSPDGKTVAVANRGANTVTFVNARTGEAQTLEVGLHPSAIGFSADGKRAYAALADDDALAIIDLVNAKIIARVALGVGGNIGASPNAIAVGADGRVFVSCGALNAIAIVSGEKRVSMAPAGWYPDGIAIDKNGTHLFVLNAKGERSHANPQFDPLSRHPVGYIATSTLGSVRRVDLRSSNQTAQVLANMPPSANLPAQTILHSHGPIKHIIYVIKENRSFDQVLSDVPGVDGDRALLLFGAGITPNQHALARRFGAFDRAFASAQVSASGHNWTDAAFANDYLERFWPVVYGNRRTLYDFEDGADASVPHSGFLWDAAAHAHITYRNYGEFVTNPSTTGSEVTTQEANLKEHTSSSYPGFDMEFSDLSRMAIWLREFRNFESADNLPALEFVRLPNDHTSGTKPGSLTPQAYVAQNDYALGQLVDAVSHSKFWASTVIFSVEDDAQNGPDHVDDQRTTYYIASPYARGGVNHTRYSTVSVVRTIELFLGLKPLSLYDAKAHPMYEAFANKPNVKPFTAIKPNLNLTEVNKKTAYGAAASAAMNFREADVNDPRVLNKILYHAAREKQ